MKDEWASYVDAPRFLMISSLVPSLLVMHAFDRQCYGNACINCDVNTQTSPLIFDLAKPSAISFLHSRDVSVPISRTNVTLKHFQTTSSASPVSLAESTLVSDA
jgi:hypothetical protein